MNVRRVRYGLSQLAMRIPESPGLAQIAQQPALFDFPRESLPDNFRYTGPWHAIESADKLEFPWQKLDGRPLIYASMGTLQNRQRPIFQAIATAYAGLDAQLVMSLGSHDQRLELKLPEAAIVVPFAPQLDLLRRCTGDHARRTEHRHRVSGPRCAHGRHSYHQRSAGRCQPSRVAGCRQSRAASAADRAAPGRQC
jgi:hypothetical protein